MKKITVVATFVARPGKETELKTVLTGLVAPTRKEKGCINYDLHVAADNPAQFLFYENWDSPELLDAHLKSAHIAAALPRAHELTAAAPEIKLWEKIA